MKKLTLILLLGLMTPFAIMAQSPTESEKTPPEVEIIEEEVVELPPIETEEDDIYTIVQQMPRFPGCEEMERIDFEKRECAERKMLEFIYKSIRYPAEARVNGIEGMVVISFIVDKNGDILDCEILRNLGGGCGKEALRVIESMPRWIPGMQDNEPVKVIFNLPVRFKLQNLVKPHNTPRKRKN